VPRIPSAVAELAKFLQFLDDRFRANSVVNGVKPSRANDTMAVDEIGARRTVLIHDLQAIIVSHRECDAVSPNRRYRARLAAFYVDREHFGVEFFDLIISFVQLDQLTRARRSPVRTGKNEH